MNFLYNGIPLPDIRSVYTPEVQAEYPYVYIYQRNSGYCGIFASPIKMEMSISYGNHALIMPNEESITYLTAGLPNGSSEWNEWSKFEYNVTLQAPFWAGTDLYYADDVEDVGGTLYLAGSKAVNAETGEEVDFSPVPVSPVKLNPALLVQSFFTGQAVRRSRGK